MIRTQALWTPKTYIHHFLSMSHNASTNIRHIPHKILQVLSFSALPRFNIPHFPLRSWQFRNPSMASSLRTVYPLCPIHTSLFGHISGTSTNYQNKPSRFHAPPHMPNLEIADAKYHIPSYFIFISLWFYIFYLSLGSVIRSHISQIWFHPHQSLYFPIGSKYLTINILYSHKIHQTSSPLWYCLTLSQVKIIKVSLIVLDIVLV
jgi:hypothetical protein